MSENEHTYCVNCERKILREIVEPVEDSNWRFNEETREWTCPRCLEHE